MHCMDIHISKGKGFIQHYINYLQGNNIMHFDVFDSYVGYQVIKYQRCVRAGCSIHLEN